jgi:phospholipid/cholesterol/gamma-HCH transport system permease protein
LASLLGVPLLCVLGTLSAALAALLTANFLGANGLAFINAQYVDTGDLACGATKALLCGLYIPLAAARRGLGARGGAPAVGEAVTRGVVEACTGCLLIDFFVALAFLGVGE